ncbi:MAG: insulinase family protein, partial [Leptolyngbyaceae cyanobacterium RU_5_1]|nr:insulinase family protein [Leptolyngbyaceae cyanobacterium RU_5_1]
TLTLLQQIRKDGLTPAEIATAKRAIASSYPVELASPNDLAGTILMNTVYRLDRTEIRQFVTKIQAITPEQVNQVIQELLYPDRLIIVTAGPPTSTSQKQAPK